MKTPIQTAGTLTALVIKSAASHAQVSTAAEWETFIC